MSLSSRKNFHVQSVSLMSTPSTGTYCDHQPGSVSLTEIMCHIKVQAPAVVCHIKVQAPAVIISLAVSAVQKLCAILHFIKLYQVNPKSKVISTDVSCLFQQTSCLNMFFIVSYLNEPAFSTYFVLFRIWTNQFSQDVLYCFIFEWTSFLKIFCIVSYLSEPAFSTCFVLFHIWTNQPAQHALYNRQKRL